LAALGRREDALAAIEEAVAIRRELAAILPVFRESLAWSLTSLGIRLTEKKDFDAALFADREAVAIYAALLSLDPERYRDPLEGAVRNLVIDLRDLGRGEQEIAGELDRLLSADDD
jgi:tetratricopeptide (TPR) repeat protein